MTGDTQEAQEGHGTRGATAHDAPGPRSSPKPLCEAYDVALLDLDGVVYLGGTAIKGAPQSLSKAAAAGMRLAYVTNNAFRTPAAVAAILTGFGVQATREDVVTSAQAAARLLADRLSPGASVLVIGGTGLRVALRERGLRPVSVASENPAAVVQGYAPGISYSMLAEGGLAVAAGALFVASNADRTLPSPRGNQPGNGSLLQVIVTATGVQPLVAGKPEPPLHQESVLRTKAKNPLVVGDRLDTDIEGAQRVKADSLLVLTGVTGPEEAVLAPPGQRPTYLAEDLTGLLEPHPAVTAADGSYACGGWTAWRTPERLELDGNGTRIDALRALCAAAWEAGEITPKQAEPALHMLAAVTPLPTGRRLSAHKSPHGAMRAPSLTAAARCGVLPAMHSRAINAGRDDSRLAVTGARAQSACCPSCCCR